MLSDALAGLQPDGSYWHRDAKHCVQDREGNWGTVGVMWSEWGYDAKDEPFEKQLDPPELTWMPCGRAHG